MSEVKSDKDGTERLCQALYGRSAKPADYLGGSNAKMLHDAADRLSVPVAGSIERLSSALPPSHVAPRADGYAVLLDDAQSAPEGLWFVGCYTKPDIAMQVTAKNKGRMVPIYFAPPSPPARQLERELADLRHDLERGMANHNADLNAPPSASGETPQQKQFERVLDEIEDFLENQQDVRDGSDGQMLPNAAMSLLTDLRWWRPRPAQGGSDAKIATAPSSTERRFPICKDHTDADWNQPTLDDACILCRLFYLEAQESLLEEWQQRAIKAEDAIKDMERPLDAQMARLNAEVVRLNSENDQHIGLLRAMRHELLEARAMYERAVEHLTRIFCFLNPPIVEAGDKRWAFKNPDANEALQALSDAIRAIPDDLRTAPSSIGAWTAQSASGGSRQGVREDDER